MPSVEGWLRTSRYLKSRRPSPRVLLLSISNPPHNLLNGDVLAELQKVLTMLSAQETGVVILTSNMDDLFISHYDVSEIVDLASLVPEGSRIPPSVIRGALYVESFLNSAFGLRPWIRRSTVAGLANLNCYHEVLHLLRSIPQVTIAAINGRAFGGGCELALACDFRFMVDTPPEGIPGEARGSGLGQPEICLGLIPGGGGTQMLTRMLGPAKALEICLEKTLLTAQEAHELGLVTKLFSRKELIPETIAFAERMARRAPAAVAAVKDSVYEGASLPLMQGMRRENGNFGSCAMVPEALFAMKKYLAEQDEILGDDTLGKFQPLQEGTFAEFRPNSAYLDKQWSRVTPRTPRPPADELVQVRQKTKESNRAEIKQRASENMRSKKVK